MPGMIRTAKKISGAVFPAIMAIVFLAWPAQSPRADEFEERVRRYLLNHPEVIIEALKNHQQSGVFERFRQLRYSDSQTPSSGPTRAPIVLAEFFDYQCGLCKGMFPNLRDVLALRNDVRIIWIELPILGPESDFAARAALAAHKQGKYLEFHEGLMALSTPLSQKTVLDLAEQLNINTETMLETMRQPETTEYLRENRALARSLGIQGTPALLRDNILVHGAVPADELARLLQ